MGFEFEEPARAEGEWVTLRDLAKLGEAITVAPGFLVDDDNNTYKGKPAPRFIVQGVVKSTGDKVKVGASKGYGRDDKFQQLASYFEEHPDETVDIKFVAVDGSQYIDVTTA